MGLRIIDNTKIRNSTQKEYRMGPLDGILGNLLGASTGAAQAPGGGLGGGSLLKSLLPVVLEMLINRQGGSGGGLANVLGGMLGGGNAGAGGLVGAALGGLLGGSGGTGGASGVGGLGGLLEQFQRAGFAEQAASWVGSGQNLPISPEAIGQVFGSDTLSQIARRVGVSEADTATGLSQLLPEVVDRVTPNGEMPDLDQLVASVAGLSRQFGG
jgi:uncharacterized protein YidB (DUF937 family)